MAALIECAVIRCMPIVCLFRSAVFAQYAPELLDEKMMLSLVIRKRLPPCLYCMSASACWMQNDSLGCLCLPPLGILDFSKQCRSSWTGSLPGPRLVNKQQKKRQPVKLHVTFQFALIVWPLLIPRLCLQPGERLMALVNKKHEVEVLNTPPPVRTTSLKIAT